ncbi:MAG: fluoride exporter [Actinomycetota bacterium]|nr:fluoride exporter [Actinomycetota bacterium]
MTPLGWVAFVVAGAIGAPLRYLLDGAVGERTDGVFPWGILLVNVSGSFLLGLLTGLGLHHGLGRTPRIVVGTGFCGAFTTFSTFTYETVRLLEEGDLAEALANLGLTVLLGAVAAAVGLAVPAVV